MAHYLNYSFVDAGKYIAVNIPASTNNSGRPLQIEWEIEFEARKNGGEFIIATGPAFNTATTLLFIRSGTDFELRSPGNSNWIVTTGITLTNFNVFKLRSTFDGTSRIQTLSVNGVVVATRNPSTAAIDSIGAFFGLNSNSNRHGDFKYFKFTDFVTPANNRLYDANASGGTGTILPETIAGVNGAQTGTWPTDDSEWVFYSAGGSAAQLQANAISTSTATAALTAGILLVAAAVSVSNSTASMTAPIELLASVVSQSTSTGNLTTGIRLAANAASVSSATAMLTTSVSLSASATGQSTATAALKTQIRFAASAVSRSTAIASLTSLGASLATNAESVSTATAQLTTGIRLVTAAVGQSTSTAGLVTQICLQVSAVSSSTATATLTNQAAQLHAAAVCQSTAIADLTVATGIQASTVSTSTVTAVLTTSIQLAANAQSRSQALAVLDSSLAYYTLDKNRTAYIARESRFTAIIGEQRFTAVDPEQRFLSVRGNA